ncbi:MAG TPA: hypothetical protein PLM79_14100 [Syntrophobacteraceae bacterium]|nr:hypothetical protein [Syntrophobacteraceae bacterium]
MKRWKLWVGLVSLFLSGMVAGALGTVVISEHMALEVLVGRGPIVEKVLKKLSRELSLTESQRERIAEIVCRTHKELTALRERNKPERDEIMGRSREAMKAELSAPQQKKLDEFFEQEKTRWAHREHGKAGGGGRKGLCD